MVKYFETFFKRDSSKSELASDRKKSPLAYTLGSVNIMINSSENKCISWLWTVTFWIL